MKAFHFFSYALILLLLTALKPTEACEYAGSNITFVKTQTEKALSKDDLNLTRYHAYKALNAIEKSKQQMEDCGCDYASIGIEESEYLLKRATKVSAIQDAKALLKRVLTHIDESISALENHHEHVSTAAKDDLAMNIADSNGQKGLASKPKHTFLKNKIDTALEKYRVSMAKVVETIDCKEAKAFAERIYQECEKELLTPNLSEGRKYYNLQTQKITAEALQNIGDCK